ncbi:MAG: hypothetical protein QOF26_802 [Baekduia sp.]|nr:hypothetical protein [Baekduia sp.]
MAGVGTDAVAVALRDLQATFAAGAQARLALVRRLAALDVGPAGAGAQRALVTALLRREAADGDETASVGERVGRVAAEAAAAAAAGERLGPDRQVAAILGEVEATWRAALDRGAALAGWLEGRAEPGAVTAFGRYVATLEALHALAPTAAPRERDAAVGAFEAALGDLARALGAPSGTI